MPDFIPTDPNTPHPLGRTVVDHDPRNRGYAALLAPPPQTRRPGQEWWTRDVYHQQGPSCTAQAAIGVCRTSPYRAGFGVFTLYDTEDERHALYQEAQRHDRWPGEDYEGSSTDAPFKVLRDRGHIAGWRWLFGEDQLREWVTYYGAAVVGTDWTNAMFRPDRQGFIDYQPGDHRAGGHAYRIVQANAERQSYRIVNSWGRTWGQSGRAWITWKAMAALLDAQGECVVPAA